MNLLLLLLLYDISVLWISIGFYLVCSYKEKNQLLLSGLGVVLGPRPKIRRLTHARQIFQTIFLKLYF